MKFIDALAMYQSAFDDGPPSRIFFAMTQDEAVDAMQKAVRKSQPLSEDKLPKDVVA